MATITDTQMHSEHGDHHAVPVQAGDPYGTWEVSWLPGRELSRCQAITAMVLTDFIGHNAPVPGSPRWTFVVGWADELHLTAEEAVTRIQGQWR